jgi:hypothetical protein
LEQEKNTQRRSSRRTQEQTVGAVGNREEGHTIKEIKHFGIEQQEDEKAAGSWCKKHDKGSSGAGDAQVWGKRGKKEGDSP